MPSQIHESLLLLFRNRPGLAAELLRDTLHLKLPAYAEAATNSAEFTDVQPAEYRADLVITLLVGGKPVFGIIVEAQLKRDREKLFTWPAYAVNLRARIHCPVCLLVVTPDPKVEQWARLPIELGGGSRFCPRVLPMSGVPEIMDERTAERDPELAVLSAIAHADDADRAKVLRIAHVAQSALDKIDEPRRELYFDLILSFLTEECREALETMTTSNYKFQSEFARRNYGLGKVEGIAEGIALGRMEIVLTLLTTRFGNVASNEVEQLKNASAEHLDAVAKRILSAQTVSEALGVAA